MQLPPLTAPPKKQERKGNPLFKTTPKKEEMKAPDYTSDITTLERRMRVLEEKNMGARNKIELLEMNMLTRHKHVTTEIKAMDSEIMELKHEVNEMKDRLLMLIKEFQESAKKEEVIVLKKYIDMWNPVQFVTRNEVKDIVKSVLENKE